MPARKPDTLAFRTLLALLGAAAAIAAAAHGAAVPKPGLAYWNPDDTASVPKTLSAMKLYLGAPGKNAKLVPEARHYEVNAPLWSDDAKKKRWVVLKPGTSIGFKDKDDYWDYPDSAVFVKEFAIDTIPGDTTSRVLWETRVLLNRKEEWEPSKKTTIDVWYGYSYKWRADQKDADLVPAGGLQDQIRIWPDGVSKPSRMKKWAFPTRSQCEHCHKTGQAEQLHGRSILGFFTAQLNREAPDTVGMNQLDWLFATGVLRGTKPYPWDYQPRWRGIDDNTASVDLRARSYIAANCSGCHGKRGIEMGAAFGVDLNYDFHEMTPRMEFRYRPVSWPFGLDTIPPFFYSKNDPANIRHLDSLPIEPALVVPGHPEKSVILFRQRARDTRPGDFDPDNNQMPPMASYEVNVPATALIEKWIKDMPVIPAPVVGVSRRPGAASAGIALRGDRLVIDAPEGNVEVTMASADGRRVALKRVSHGVWALPGNLPKGLYFIRVGSRMATRYLL